MLRVREPVYDIISGCGSIEDYRNKLVAFYKRYSMFTEYVNSVYDFGDNSQPLDKQVSERLLETVNVYMADVMNKMNSAGGKFLISTHLFLYYRFMPSAIIPEIGGLTTIC